LGRRSKQISARLTFLRSAFKMKTDVTETVSGVFGVDERVSFLAKLY
jgi:hypothetical protein